MEKAIEIKRRAQRCIQNGDLDGALAEYEKLVHSEESDPYNFVLLADLLYKKGEQGEAAERYLAAVSAYERASLFKNAIAVCKKMLRLSLAPMKVLPALANLHALDGLAGEASLYHIQYAELMMRANEPATAAAALRQAFDVCQDNVKVLEQLSEAWMLAGENTHAADALAEAAQHYQARNQAADAQRVLDRAAHLAPGHTPDPNAAQALESASAPPAFAPEPAVEMRSYTPEPGALELESTHLMDRSSVSADSDRLDGFETGRHEVAPPRLPMDDAIVSPATPIEAAVEPPVGDAVAPAVDEDNFRIPAAAHLRAAEGPDAQPEKVYEIAEAEEVEVIAAPADEAAEAPVYEIGEETESDAHALETPASPGLNFGTPVAAALESSDEDVRMAEVESLLARAQEQFRAEDREAATATLTQAAQAYEALGRFDSAVTIYRSLGRGAHSTPRLMQLWLANCEAREDLTEAAQVACELGDRALNQSDEAEARTWFEKAIAFDANNEVAQRRLQRLNGAVPPPQAPVAAAVPAPAAPVVEPQAEGGRVEVAVGRGEAVTFDLSGLLAEFQRGVETQLAGDAQSHYDLGMTYREMGLLEQAVDSFRVAEQDPKLTARSLEMIGRCFDDQGRHAEAATEFRRALDAPGASVDTLAELRLDLAQALAHGGDTAGAQAELARVEQERAEDVMLMQRVGELRESLGLS